MTLSKLKKHQRAAIKKLPVDLSVSGRLLEQGFLPQSEISLAHKAPFNGPMAFYLQGSKISIQQHVAEQIHIELL